jgi:hypothetical protein
MNIHSESEHVPVTLKPERSVFRQSVVAVGLGSTLLFAVLYWLAIPAGDEEAVAALQAGILFCTVVAARQFLDTRIVLVDDGVEERGFLGNKSRVARGAVHLILIVQIYEHHSAETLSHLFVADASSRLLLRMRGQYWREHDIDRVAAHLGSTIVRSNQAVSMAEFYAVSPNLLYWFERPIHFGRITARGQSKDFETHK